MDVTQFGLAELTEWLSDVELYVNATPVSWCRSKYDLYCSWHCYSLLCQLSTSSPSISAPVIYRGTINSNCEWKYKNKKWLYISTGDPNPPITPKLSLNPNLKLTITLTLFLAFNPRCLALVYSQKHLLVVIYLCHNLFVVKPIKLPPMDQPGVSVTRIRVKTLLRLVVGLGSLWLVLG